MTSFVLHDTNARWCRPLWFQTVIESSLGGSLW